MVQCRSSLFTFHLLGRFTSAPLKMRWQQLNNPIQMVQQATQHTQLNRSMVSNQVQCWSESAPVLTHRQDNTHGDTVHLLLPCLPFQCTNVLEFRCRLFRLAWHTCMHHVFAATWCKVSAPTSVGGPNVYKFRTIGKVRDRWDWRVQYRHVWDSLGQFNTRGTCGTGRPSIV